MQCYKVAPFSLYLCHFDLYFFRRIFLFLSSAVDILLLTGVEKEKLKLKERGSVGAGDVGRLVGAGDDVGLVLTDGDCDGAGDTLGALLTVGNAVGIGVVGIGGQRRLQQEHSTPSGGQSTMMLPIFSFLLASHTTLGIAPANLLFAKFTCHKMVSRKERSAKVEGILPVRRLPLKFK